MARGDDISVAELMGDRKVLLKIAALLSSAGIKTARRKRRKGKGGRPKGSKNKPESTT